MFMKQAFLISALVAACAIPVRAQGIAPVRTMLVVQAMPEARAAAALFFCGESNLAKAIKEKGIKKIYDAAKATKPDDHLALSIRAVADFGWFIEGAIDAHKLGQTTSTDGTYKAVICNGTKLAVAEMLAE